MLKATLLALALTTATAAHAELVAVTGIVRIIDGDTFVLDGERIRLEGPDAPELHKARCPNEKAVAVQATERLQELIGTGPLLIERHGLDRFGRTLAFVYANGDGEHEVGDILIEERLAVEWKPGRAAWAERARHWCPTFYERVKP